jgi:two-component system, chemotaxis family, chemotaxis protein CheY
LRVLIVEDDFVSRKILHNILSAYGECDIAADGKEAVEAFKMALDDSAPYDLICMDIMMPRMNGQEALLQIRQLEADLGIRDVDAVKVIMTTAVDDKKHVTEAFYQGGAASYFVKPINKERFLGELKILGLIDQDPPALKMD